MFGDEGFKQMTNTSRTLHFTQLMEAKYEAAFGKVKDALKSTNNKISLTVDIKKPQLRKFQKGLFQLSIHCLDVTQQTVTVRPINRMRTTK